MQSRSLVCSRIGLVYLSCTSLEGFCRFQPKWRFVFSVTYVSSTTGLGSIPTRASKSDVDLLADSAVPRLIVTDPIRLHFRRMRQSLHDHTILFRFLA
jgi:hypothetical protein